MDKNKLKNIFAGLMVKSSTLVSQLVLVPVYLNFLGIDLYGEWLLLITIPSYLLLSDLGLTITISNTLCKLHTVNHHEEATALFKSTNSLLFIISMVICLLSVFLTGIVDVKSLLGFDRISNFDVSLTLIFYSINIGLTLLFNFNLAQFKVYGKFYAYEFTNSLLYGLDFLSTALVLVLSLNLYYIPLFLAVNRAIFFLFVTRQLKKIDYYSFGFSRTITPAQKMIPAALNYSAYSIGTILFLQGCSMVVGLKLGSERLVVFNTIRTMSNSIKAFVGILYLPSMPEFTVLFSMKKIPEVKYKLRRLLLITLIAALIISSSIFIFQIEIFRLWVGDAIEYSSIFLLSMFLSNILQCMWNATSMVFLSINKNKILFIFLAIASLVIVLFGLCIKSFTLTHLSIFLFTMDTIIFIIFYSYTVRLIKFFKSADSSPLFPTKHN